MVSAMFPLIAALNSLPARFFFLVARDVRLISASGLIGLKVPAVNFVVGFLNGFHYHIICLL